MEEGVMAHAGCRVGEYQSLRPSEFADLDRLELHQLLPPEVERAELVLSLRLRPRAAADSRRLCLRFRGVVDLQLRQTASVMTVQLEVLCIAGRQWEALHYKVHDAEYDTISFYCIDLEGEIEVE